MSILKAGKPKGSNKIQTLRDELEHGSKMVRFSMNMPRDMHKKFRKKAFNDDIDMKDVLIEAIEKYLKS